MKYTVSGYSDVGLVRKLNEDAIGFDETCGIFVLADGMGGHACGEVASAELVRTALEMLRVKYESGMKDKAARVLIEKAIIEANGRIFSAASADPAKKGMGTTAVVALIAGKNLHVGWVGDSRLYIYRKDRLAQITRDHSKVQMLIDAKIIGPEDAMTHPERNIIMRAVGTSPEVKVDVKSEKLKKGDILLLCTDGVCGYVDDPDISAAIAGDSDTERIARELVQTANDRGGADNSSVIVVRIDGF